MRKLWLLSQPFSTPPRGRNGRVRVFAAVLQTLDHLLGDRSLLLQQPLPPFGEGAAEFRVGHERSGWLLFLRHGMSAIGMRAYSSMQESQVESRTEPRREDPREDLSPGSSISLLLAVSASAEMACLGENQQT